MSALDLAYAPMLESDLDEVAQAEGQLHHFPWSRRQFAESLAAGHKGWVARLAGELVGYGIFLLLPDEAELLDVAILAPWQRQGLGCALLDFLLKAAWEGGARAMFLEVRASNLAGIALYQGAGFAQVGLRRGYYPAHHGREDALVMGRNLP